MAPASRKGIPVPREQRNATQGRRPSMRDATQAPWRSSLDLVWSYSRSQAFYGDNIATSPSFADRHWAGPSNGGIDSFSVEEEDSDFDEEEEEVLTEDASQDDDDDDDDVDYDRGADMTASAAGAMDWSDEQLPANAYRRGSSGRVGSSVTLGARERRREGRTPEDRHRVKDRRISRLTVDDQGEEERSRSRSRSPKRLNSVRAASSLRIRDSQSSNESESSGKGEVKSRIARTKRGSTSQDDANESSPLLTPSGLEARQPDERLLRTPSWFRTSGTSGTNTKFRTQGYGTSTFWQSWFNTVNALVGVGILALPLAISYAGLIPGIFLFLLCGLVTNHTGKVLAHIMSTEPSLRTYADIGNFAFGTKARLVVSFFFCIELWAVATALIILFGDSARALVMSSVGDSGSSGFLEFMSSWPPAAYKVLGTLIVLPTMFLPLKFLSPISVVGIISIATLFFVVLSDGLIKKHAPGSLWEPADFSLGPRWSRLPLSFGLIMSGFSTHPIVPSLFKDMRNPSEFCKMLNWAYAGATVIYLSMGVCGYLMFGNEVSDEITRDLAHNKGYPKVLNKVAIWLIIINPLSKFALAARPITTTMELIFGVENSQVNRLDPIEEESNQARKSNYASVEESPSQAHLVAEAAAAAYNEGDTQQSKAVKSDDGSLTPRLGGGGGTSASALTIGRDVDGHPGQSPLAGSAISLRAAQRTANWSKRSKIWFRLCLQITITIAVGLTAIVLPGFGRVMAFLGAFLACTTCIFGPLLANLKLLHHEMSRLDIILDVIILVTFAVVAALGTVWSFLPLS
ncbi:hypothetical protein CBS101457_005432 [Exobasidium rhododendri]|nr:hypothetical protein CBS101457_005432 [Exobasidium rhododendri]